MLAIHGDAAPGVSDPRAGSDVARGTASTPSELFFFRPFLLRAAVDDGILPLFSCAAKDLIARRLTKVVYWQQRHGCVPSL